MLPARRLVSAASRPGRLYSSSTLKPATGTNKVLDKGRDKRTDTDADNSMHKTPVAVKHSMLKRDAELLAKLLDRDGGEAGVAVVDGAYEEGLGRETKKNMFRLI